MKNIIFSDVHGNLEALQAAIQFIRQFPEAQVYSLGDIVGYGANPKECLSEVKRIAHVSLVGNHDHAAVGLTSIQYFNPYAKEAIIWTANHLDKEEKDYLTQLPIYRIFPQRFYLVHSTPIHPEAWHYIMTPEDASKNFYGFDEPICFIGHSHAPMVIELGPNGALELKTKELIQLRHGFRYLINVGSIGQPRDGDWRACLIIYDEDLQRIEIKRLEYDVSKAQDKILKAGLPEFLAIRLQYGR